MFRAELAKLGLVEGRNLAIEYRSADGRFERLPALAVEYRSADGRFERLPALAVELVRLEVDVIVAVVTQASVAAKAATTIPIVVVGVGDPVGAGLVSSFSRPAGNVTGTSGAVVDRRRSQCWRSLQGGRPLLRFAVAR